MRRSLLIATVAGAVLAGGVAAGPALAATRGPDGTSGPGAGSGAVAGCGAWGDPDGSGGRAFGMGGGMGGGVGMMGRWNDPDDVLDGTAQGTLSADQKTALAATAEREKLAHDVYAALATSSGDVRFGHIALADQHHLQLVRALLARYGVTDPTAGRAAGQFATASVQEQYRDLVARGGQSASAALAVGRRLEADHLAALEAARAGVTAPDVLRVYTMLAHTTTMQLRAFGG